MTDEPAPKPRRRQPEHALQVQIKKWTRENVFAPHVFLGFDRAAKQSPFQHIREKARGVEGGTPDVVLLVEGAAVWVELKAGKNGLSEHQVELHTRMASAGFAVGVCRTVEEYARELHARNVLLRPGAFERAQGADRTLAVAAAVPKVPPRASKPRAARATKGALRVARGFLTR